MQKSKSKNHIPFADENNILKQSQQENFPYYVSINAKKYRVLEQVFSPKYFPDIEMFIQNLPIKPHSRFLEIGTGIGFSAIEAAYRGATTIVATDINPYAIENTKQNSKLHGFSECIDTRQGSVFNPISEQERFDVIYWNVPFQLIDKPISIDLLQAAICDKNYQFIQEYIQQGEHYLSENGRLFMGFSSSIGCMQTLKRLVKQLEHATLRYAAKKIVTRNNIAVSFELIEIVYTK